MNWVQIAKKGIDAEIERKNLRYQHIQRKNALVQCYGKWGFLISYIEEYSEVLNPEMRLSVDIILVILKMLVHDNNPERVRYYYVPFEGRMNSSPFRYYMERFSPYENMHLSPIGPMHDLSLHHYKLFIEESYIVLHTISTSSRSRDFRIYLDLGLLRSDILPLKTFKYLLKDISCFEQFQAKLFKIWNVTDEILDNWCPFGNIVPDIFDPRPNKKFYKMHQMWAVIYTIRGMIDFPL